MKKLNNKPLVITISVILICIISIIVILSNTRGYKNNNQLNPKSDLKSDEFQDDNTELENNIEDSTTYTSINNELESNKEENKETTSNTEQKSQTTSKNNEVKSNSSNSTNSKNNNSSSSNANSNTSSSSNQETNNNQQNNESQTNSNNNQNNNETSNNNSQNNNEVVIEYDLGELVKDDGYYQAKKNTDETYKQCEDRGYNVVDTNKEYRVNYISFVCEGVSYNGHNIGYKLMFVKSNYERIRYTWE